MVFGDACERFVVVVDRCERGVVRIGVVCVVGHVEDVLVGGG